MKKISLRENGLVGTLFRPSETPFAVIVLGGSSGGLKEGRAELLAAHGLNALALAYFGAESLPQTLNQIPLEYFEKAFSRLEEEGIQGIGLWGVSRGAELALILGTLFPDRIDAIAAHVPSSVIYGAFDNEIDPAWTYRGKQLAPNAPFKRPLVYNKETPISPTSWFLDAMEDREGFAASAIPVEKIRCPLLLISAEDDQMWPSALFAQQVIDRLEAHRSPIAVSHLRYPGVGHSPEKGLAGFHPIMKIWLAFGGNPKDNAFAARDWNERTVSFFNGSSKSLADSPSRSQFQ